MFIIKRDGTKVPFDKDKIIRAINGAMLEVDGKVYEYDTAKDIANDIEKELENKSIIGVEEIQDMVEDYLMRSERRDVARAYIRFRYKKEVARGVKDDFIKAVVVKKLLSLLKGALYRSIKSLSISLAISLAVSYS